LSQDTGWWGCCEYGDESSVSGATESLSHLRSTVGGDQRFKGTLNTEETCKAVTLRHAGVKGREVISPTHSRRRHSLGVFGQRHASAALYSRERTPVPIGYQAGWASELVWTQRLQKKYFASAGNRTPSVKSVVRHCHCKTYSFYLRPH
jgi:hypothetical protein